MKFLVKEIAKEKGLSMEELANRLGCKRQNLTKTLANNPTIGTLEKIALALNVPLLSIFDMGDIPHEETNSSELRIKELCQIQGITLKDLAERLSISPSAMTQNLKNPTLGVLKKIADGLGVEISELSKPKEDFIAILRENGEMLFFNSRAELKKHLSEISS